MDLPDKMTADTEGPICENGPGDVLIFTLAGEHSTTLDTGHEMRKCILVRIEVIGTYGPLLPGSDQAEEPKVGFLNGHRQQTKVQRPGPFRVRVGTQGLDSLWPIVDHVQVLKPGDHATGCLRLVRRSVWSYVKQFCRQ